MLIPHMKLRIIFIVVGIVAVVVIIGLATLYFAGPGSGGSTGMAGQSQAPSVGTGAATSGTGGTGSTPIAEVYPSAPTGMFFGIGTPKGVVEVKNFYNPSSTVGEDGTIIIKQTPDYWFAYNPQDSSFWVAVSGTPFAVVRQAAEADFIVTLGVSQADACKLNVSVGVPYSAGNPLNGQSFPLGFCGL